MRHLVLLDMYRTQLWTIDVPPTETTWRRYLGTVGDIALEEKHLYYYPTTTPVLYDLLPPTFLGFIQLCSLMYAFCDLVVYHWSDSFFCFLLCLLGQLLK
jgi:hypothetical protein